MCGLDFGYGGCTMQQWNAQHYPGGKEAKQQRECLPSLCLIYSLLSFQDSLQSHWIERMCYFLIKIVIDTFCHSQTYKVELLWVLHRTNHWVHSSPTGRLISLLASPFKGNNKTERMSILPKDTAVSCRSRNWTYLASKALHLPNYILLHLY